MLILPDREGTIECCPDPLPEEAFKVQPWQLQQRVKLPFLFKPSMSVRRIIQWYEYHNGKVYISFSGGKDSIALLHLVRSIYPDVPAVFVNTGLEFPEIVDFVKTIPNVIWLKPEMHFSQVLKKYGYPVISKKVAMGFDRYHNTKSDLQKELRLHGGINPTSGKKQYRTISLKYHYLIDAPFSISDRCCDVMKKRPLKKFHKETGLFPFTGEMVGDSDDRRQNHYKTGCNAFGSSTPKSTPMSFWTEEDVWNYIKANGIPYCKIYDMGYDRTGCIFCAFGILMEGSPNRFQIMYRTHHSLWKHVMFKLGLAEILDYMGIPYYPDDHGPLFKAAARR